MVLLNGEEMSLYKCSDADYRQLIDCCADAILIIDEQEIVMYANHSAEIALERTADDMIGRSLPLKLPKGYEGEILRSKMSGGQVILDVRKRACILGGCSVTVLTLRDIIDQKYLQAAQLVEELSHQQHEKWKSLESLAGGIAHQFNNLLMVILSQCSALKRGLTYDQPRMDRIEYIEKSSIRAIEITNHLLAFAGLGKYEFREINISNTIAGIKYIFDTATSRKTKIEYNLDPEIPVIYGDESQLQRMLYEIIINAKEAMCREKGIVSITTGSISLNNIAGVPSPTGTDLADGDYVYIQIADNGSGMDEETQAQIFHPLFTTKASAKGLGLSAALGIARTHKGTISVHTVENHGTTIEIFLPVATGRDNINSEDIIKMASDIISTADLNPPYQRGVGGRILIAEDEAYMRDILQEALENSGFRVTTSEDGKDCIEKFDALDQQFDCIILDMMMPNLDGEETLAEIRKRGSIIPVIITSGFTRQTTIDELRSAGVKFLQKPYKLGDLMSLVTEILKQSTHPVK